MKNNSSIILLLLSAGLFYTFTNVQYKEVMELRNLAKEYQNILSNVSSIVETRDRLLVTYESLSDENINRVTKILPDNVDTVRLALDLDTMASRYGISVGGVQVSDGSDQERVVLPESSPYKKTVISFSFVSNYDDFISFLGDLEKSLRIMDVKSLSFQSNESGIYRYNISVETNWLK